MFNLFDAVTASRRSLNRMYSAIKKTTNLCLGIYILGLDMPNTLQSHDKKFDAWVAKIRYKSSLFSWPIFVKYFLLTE